LIREDKTMKTLFYRVDYADDNESVSCERLEETTTAPLVGASVPMDRALAVCDWEVIATHIFKSTDPDYFFCLAEVAQGPVVEHSLPGAIELYMLDGQHYNYSIAWGQLSPPELGPFEEYAPAWPPTDQTNSDPIPCKRLPLDKQIVSYERLTGDEALSVYVVQLERVPTLVAA
jgi:hypothetical protein